MQNAAYAVREQLVKTVVKSGNGGAVWVPKSWLGEEVIVILPEKPKLDMPGRIFTVLKPYLPDILGVAIFGSFARREQTKDSDVDVIVVMKERPLPFAKKENMEIVSLSLASLKRAMEKLPELYFQMVRESKPLINSPLFDELKKIPFDGKAMERFWKETKEHLRSNREFIALDKEQGTALSSYSALYSTLLRLRSWFIIRCIARKEDFLMSKFRRWLILRGMGMGELKDALNAFSLIRDGKQPKEGIVSLKTTEKLLTILSKELEKEESKA